MPVENPYYNPTYDQAAERLSNAIFGNPEKAGQLAYKKAQERLAGTRADRLDIENRALSGGLSAAITAGGDQPASISAGMPALLQALAAAKVSNPSAYTGPLWAAHSGAQSGAPPAEALARSAYIGRGSAVPTDLALTPGRQDEIRRDKASAGLAKALAVQALKNQAPSKTAGTGSIANINAVLNSVLSSIPGATELDTYKREKINPDVMDYLSSSGLFEAMRGVASENIGGGTEYARQALIERMGLPTGARFDTEAILEPGGWSNILPGGKPFSHQRGPSFVGPEGNVIDLSRILAPPAAPTGLPTPAEAAAELARRRGAVP